MVIVTTAWVYTPVIDKTTSSQFPKVSTPNNTDNKINDALYSFLVNCTSDTLNYNGLFYLFFNCLCAMSTNKKSF